MSEAKKLWTGTWMGIDAHVEMIGGAPAAFLSGRRAQFEGDVLGILGAAVVGLAEDARRSDLFAAEMKALAEALLDEKRAVRTERDALRDRLAKLEGAR